jgi:hypothetical protein
VPQDSDDPSAVRSVAVTVEDVLAAFEATQQAGREAVLRVTPPFSGRMRARLHVTEVVPGDEAAREADPDEEGPAPVEIPAGKLLVDVPAYPTPDDTEDALRADPDAEYTRERHRERHEQALAEWRERARASIADAVAVETDAGPHQIDVVVLGE